MDAWQSLAPRRGEAQDAPNQLFGPTPPSKASLTKPHGKRPQHHGLQYTLITYTPNLTEIAKEGAHPCAALREKEMTAYEKCLDSLKEKPRTWLVTGAAGFIGSNLVETLLLSGQSVRGLDNFCTGFKKNLDMVRALVGETLWKNFSMVEGDIRSLETCRELCHGVHHVLHEAAIGSVVRSIEDPIFTNENNISGFVNMLVSARDAGATFVYAASSSTYGDEPNLPKREDIIGSPLSPYAVTKYVNELYAQVFASAYGYKSIGLRYFNIFGQRQDPLGAYAAVIPLWYAALLKGETVYINGDGETTRDFCFIENCVQANLLASTATAEAAWNTVYNVAFGESISLNTLFDLLQAEVKKHIAGHKDQKAVYRDFRAGDVRHSLADIGRAKTLLGYEPLFDVRSGLARAGEWYARNLDRS